MLIGPLVFLLLAGVVVMFDPLMVMGKPDWTPAENKPGVPARSALPHAGHHTSPRLRRNLGPRGSRTPQNR